MNGKTPLVRTRERSIFNFVAGIATEALTFLVLAAIGLAIAYTGFLLW
jgi:hypothetical protein